MQKLRLIVIILASIVATSCSNYKDIRVEKIKSASLRELNGSTAIVDIALQVSNPTNSAVHLRKVDLNVDRKGTKFAHIDILEPITVAARSNAEANLAVEVRLTNVLSSGFMLLSKRLKPDDFVVNGYIKVSAFPFSKKIRLTNQNVGALIKSTESANKQDKQTSTR